MVHYEAKKHFYPFNKKEKTGRMARTTYMK